MHVYDETMSMCCHDVLKPGNGHHDHLRTTHEHMTAGMMQNRAIGLSHAQRSNIVMEKQMYEG